MQPTVQNPHVLTMPTETQILIFDQLAKDKDYKSLACLYQTCRDIKSVVITLITGILTELSAISAIAA
jgi:hypothetical protein